MRLTIKLRPILFPQSCRDITEQLCATDRQVLERLSLCQEATQITSIEVLFQELFNRFSTKFKKSLTKLSQSGSVTCKYTTNNSWTCWLKKPSIRASNQSLTSWITLKMESTWEVWPWQFVTLKKTLWISCSRVKPGEFISRLISTQFLPDLTAFIQSTLKVGLVSSQVTKWSVPNYTLSTWLDPKEPKWFKLEVLRSETPATSINHSRT